MTTYFFAVFPKWQDFQNLYRQKVDRILRHVYDDNNEQPCSGLDY